MSGDSAVRDIISNWYLKRSGNVNVQKPKPEILLKYFKALMSFAAADGVLHDDERRWVIGKAAVVGMHL